MPVSSYEDGRDVVDIYMSSIDLSMSLCNDIRAVVDIKPWRARDTQ